MKSGSAVESRSAERSRALDLAVSLAQRLRLRDPSAAADLEALAAMLHGGGWPPPPACEEEIPAFLRDAEAALDVAEGFRPGAGPLPDECSGVGARRFVRSWLVPDWLASGRVHLLSGPGGAGKSRLAVALGAAVCGARPFWLPGLPVQGGGPVFFVSWEDEPEELAERCLQASGGQGRDALSAGFFTMDAAPEGPVWAPVRGAHVSTRGVWTRFGKHVLRRAAAREAVLLILDPVAAAFGSDENSRPLVREFLSSLDAWGRMHGAAVLLIAHPPKGGAVYSGSTDWRNAVRCVWHLGGAGSLQLEKSNYGPSGAEVAVQAPSASPKLDLAGLAGERPGW